MNDPRCPRCNDGTWVIHDGMFHWHCPACGLKDTDITYTTDNKTEPLNYALLDFPSSLLDTQANRRTNERYAVERPKGDGRMKIILDNHTKSIGVIGCKRCKSVVELFNTDLPETGSKHFVCPLCGAWNWFLFKDLIRPKKWEMDRINEIQKSCIEAWEKTYAQIKSLSLMNKKGD